MVQPRWPVLRRSRQKGFSLSPPVVMPPECDRVHPEGGGECSCQTWCHRLRPVGNEKRSGIVKKLLGIPSRPGSEMGAMVTQRPSRIKPGRLDRSEEHTSELQ